MLTRPILILLDQVRELVSLSAPRRGAEHGRDQFARRPFQPLLRPGVNGRGHHHGDESGHERGEGESVSISHGQGAIEDPVGVERESLAVPGDLSQIRRRVSHPQRADETGDRLAADRELQLGKAAVQLSEEPCLHAGAAAATTAASKPTTPRRPSGPPGEIRVHRHRICLTSGTDALEPAASRQLPATIADRARGRSSCTPEPGQDDGSTIEQRATPATAVRSGRGLSARVRGRFPGSEYHRSDRGASSAPSQYRAAAQIGALQRWQIGQRLGSWKRSLHRLLFGVRRSGSAQKT